MAQKEISSKSTEAKVYSSSSPVLTKQHRPCLAGCSSGQAAQHQSGGSGLDGGRLLGRAKEEGEGGGSSLSPVLLAGADLEGSLAEKAYF